MITMKMKGFDAAVAALKVAPKRLREEVGDAIEDGLILIEKRAKDKAPDYTGYLRANINHVTDRQQLIGRITVNAFYAAYVEFGTGHYAAQYVGTLPGDWQTYARTFKGKTGGDIDKFLEIMVRWVKLKGLHGLTKSNRSRTGKKADADAYNLAYVIVINILRNGIHPHPFLFPAVRDSREQVEKLMIAAVNRAIQ